MENPLSIALDQVDDMALCVAVGINKLIQNSDRGVLDNLSKKDDAREERRAAVPASVRALAEGGPYES